MADKYPSPSSMGKDKKGTQPNHYVTDGNNTTKYAGDSGVPLSAADKKALSQEVNKIFEDAKAKAKLEAEKRNAPKTNWITKL